METSNQSITHRIKAFANSFDTKNWDLMLDCLSDQIYTDYSGFRGTAPQVLDKKEYVIQREIALKELDTQHEINNFVLDISSKTAHCRCNFQIQRFTKDHNKHLHTNGYYRFKLEKVNNSWKICSISQKVFQTQGDKSIHAAFQDN